jgi:hypothetical protein
MLQCNPTQHNNKKNLKRVISTKEQFVYISLVANAFSSLLASEEHSAHWNDMLK